VAGAAMKLPEKTDAAWRLIDALGADGAAYRRRSRAAGQRPDEPDPFDFPDLFARIHRLCERLDGEDIAEFLTVLDDFMPELRDAAIAWVDLLHILIQDAETRYRRKGQGQLKKDEVKTVVIYLIRADRCDIPGVPRYLEPLVVDVVVDVLVDSIVAFLNLNKHRDLNWDVGRSNRTLYELFRRVKRVVVAVLEFVIVRPVSWVVSRIYFAFHRPSRLTPALRSAVEAVNEHSLTVRRKGLLEWIANIGTWIGHNRHAVVEGVQIVTIVVDSVEAYADLDGPAKKVIARRFVYDVLDEFGFDYSNPVVKVKLDAGIGFAIDSVVHLFHRRDLFERRTTRREPAPPLFAVTPPEAGAAPPSWRRTRDPLAARTSTRSTGPRLPARPRSRFRVP
jgi:hypothetical protein